jgi:hypothetical protein
MPKIGKARDARMRGEERAAERFSQLHRRSVIVNGIQLVMLLFVAASLLWLVREEYSNVKVWRARVGNSDLDLRMKGLMPLDRRILQQVGRKLTLPGSPDYSGGHGVGFWNATCA